MKNVQKLLLAVAVSAALAGCATTRSDSLGLAENETVKTYAEAYQPARDMLFAGKFDELKAKVLENGKDKEGKELTKEEAYEKLLTSASELSIMERGLLALNTGDVDRALFFFDAAEEKLNLAEDQTGVTDQAAGASKSLLASVTGAKELADYEVRSYEKVMLLNYKALCYMLKGDRKAYNVTRRAIDLQQEEWEKFQQEKAKFEEEHPELFDENAQKEAAKKQAAAKAKAEAEAKAKAEAQKKAQAQQTASQQQAKDGLEGLAGAFGGMFGGSDAKSSTEAAGNAAQTAVGALDALAALPEIIGAIDVDDRSADTKKKAGLVTSAYVNPFGDYMNALLQEFDSLEDRSLRDNARISYEKVVENNKDCKAAVVAKKDVMKGLRKNQKLVQVILSDGFAPYQKESSKSFRVGKYQATLNYANATPVDTPVVGAKVNAGGKTTRMSSLTKMESIILRDEQDRMPWRVFDTAMALLRSGMANDKLGILGDALTSAVQHPDTRSWLSLPNQVLVSRLVVPANLKTIDISTVDKSGKVLAKNTVKIAEKGPTVVYAVNYGTHLQTFANEFSWVK